MTLNEIVELFKDIAVAHPDINSFHTGLNFEHNDSNINYPAFRMVFPYDVAYKQENQVAEYTFNLTVFVNDVVQEVMDSTKLLNTNYMIQDSVLDESIGDLKDENKMRSRALGIMNNVLETLIEQEACLDYFQIKDYKIKALERANNDFVTGVRLTLKVRTDNTYRCEYPNLLECDTILDTSGCPDCPEPPVPLRKSLDFNFVDNYLTISQTTSTIYDIDWQQPLSFECWYKPTAGVFGVLWSKISANAGMFVGTTFTGRVRFQVRTTAPGTDGIIDVFTPENAIINDEWNHIVINYNGGGGAEQDVTFVINGVESAKPNTWTQGNQLLGGSSITTTFAEIMRVDAFGFFGGGKIAHTRLWRNIELTTAESLTLYHGGKVLYDNIPQSNDILFELGFGDEGHAWFGATGWIMEEISKSSNFVFARASQVSDVTNDIP